MKERPLDIAAKRIEWEASLKGIEVSVKKSKSEECIVIYNPVTEKAVSLVPSGKTGKGVSTYSINVPRGGGALEEGFTVEDISKSKILREELFLPIKFSESVSQLI